MSQSWFLTTLNVTTSTSVWAIQLNGWNFATATSASSLTTSTTGLSSEPTAPLASQTIHSGGLATGTKIGIGVGVPLAIIGLGAFLLAVITLRRRHRFGK